MNKLEKVVLVLAVLAWSTVVLVQAYKMGYRAGCCEDPEVQAAIRGD